MRLRQFVVVARDLDSVVADFTAVLGIEVAFNDPSVKEFGLRNAVMPVGDTFLEVVSPIDPKATAERYLERRRGDGGYMLILQCDDLDRDRERLARLGVRTVWKLDLPEIRGTHLHPKDTGGTLLSIDEAKPPESWRWAGPQWREHVRRTRVDEIVAAELQCADPAALARRWSQVLDRPAQDLAAGGAEIALERGRLRFVPDRDGRGEGLSACEVLAADPNAILRTARARGLTVSGDCVTIGGVRIGLGGERRKSAVA
jgi:Glyoxalase-like domain